MLLLLKGEEETGNRNRRRHRPTSLRRLTEGKARGGESQAVMTAQRPSTSRVPGAAGSAGPIPRERRGRVGRGRQGRGLERGEPQAPQDYPEYHTRA